MKITMIGKSGAGKTSYMAALHEVLGANTIQGFSISPSAANYKDSIRKLGVFDDLSFAKRNFSFPPGTNQTTIWSFDLFHQTRLVCDFEWIDYRGGILEDIFASDLDLNTGKQAAVDELMGHIAMSNAVLLFADAITLTRYSNRNERRMHSGARIINALIKLYGAYNQQRNLNIVIVITKADSDLIESKWKENNYEQLSNLGLNAFEEVATLIRSNGRQWSGAIICVGAVGEGNVCSVITKPETFRSPYIVNATISKYPEPMNAHHPLFYCVGQVLSKMADTASRNANQYENQVLEALTRSSWLMDFWTSLTKQSNPRDLARELAEKRKYELENLQILSHFINPLFKLAAEKVRVI
jgi:GTPase SAR1 family protein